MYPWWQWKGNLPQLALYLFTVNISIITAHTKKIGSSSTGFSVKVAFLSVRIYKICSGKNSIFASNPVELLLIILVCWTLNWNFGKKSGKKRYDVFKLCLFDSSWTLVLLHRISIRKKARMPSNIQKLWPIVVQFKLFKRFLWIKPKTWFDPYLLINRAVPLIVKSRPGRINIIEIDNRKIKTSCVFRRSPCHHKYTFFSLFLPKFEIYSIDLVGIINVMHRRLHSKITFITVKSTSCCWNVLQSQQLILFSFT